MSRDMGIRGMTPEVEGYVEADRVSDGTVGTTRQQHTEAEMMREEGWQGHIAAHLHAGEIAFSDPRGDLLRRAAATPPVLREYAMAPLDDRLLIKYASFREGYVCTTCDGSGASVQDCTFCHGTKRMQFQDRLGNDKFEACTHCYYTGSEAMTPSLHGKEPCETCKGNGLAKGVLAIPDEAKRDHSYGDIISIGDQVYDLAPGDRVCFSKMAGIHIHNDKVDTNKRETHYCLLRRVEVMGLMLRV